MNGGAGAVDHRVLLDGIRTGLDRAVACVEAIATAVEAVLARLPDAVGRSARTEVAELRRRVTDVDTRLTALLATPGDPVGLRAVGAAWVERVAEPVSRLVGVATVDVAQADDRWTGVAADAYRDTLPAQQAALTAIVAAAHDVDSTLEDLAAAITKFWIAVGTACLAMVVALAGALASATTVVGAPVAAGAAIGGVGVMVTAVGAALSGLTDVMTVASSRAAALRRRLFDHTAFPLGRWPRSTTAIGTDASVTDGDGSDWQPR